jgi:hypothetical protein
MQVQHADHQAHKDREKLSHIEHKEKENTAKENREHHVNKALEAAMAAEQGAMHRYLLKETY